MNCSLAIFIDCLHKILHLVIRKLELEDNLEFPVLEMAPSIGVEVHKEALRLIRSTEVVACLINHRGHHEKHFLNCLIILCLHLKLRVAATERIRLPTGALQTIVEALLESTAHTHVLWSTSTTAHATHVPKASGTRAHAAPKTSLVHLHATSTARIWILVPIRLLRVS